MDDLGSVAVRPAPGRHRRLERRPNAQLGPAVGVETASLAGHLLGDRYRVDGPSDSGTSVLRAHDERLRRWVRISLVNLDSDSVELIWGGPGQDSPTLHPALTTLLDAGHDQRTGLSYLVTDLPGGHWLEVADAVRQGLTPGRTCSVLAELADLLAALHSRGLGHGGLAPGAIRLDADPAASGSVQVDLVGLYVQSQDPDDRKTSQAQDVFDLGVLMTRSFQAFRLPPAPGDHFPFADKDLLGWAELTAAILAADPADRPAAADVQQALAAPDPTTTSGLLGDEPLGSRRRRFGLRQDRRR